MPDVPSGTPRDDVGPNLNELVYERLLARRIVLIDSELDDAAARRVVTHLLMLDAEAPELDINLYLNSPGGPLTAGMAVHDAMQLVEADVSTWAMGVVASTAQFLLCAGTPGKRHALPNARIVLRLPEAAVGGTASEIAVQAEVLDQMRRQMAELTAARTGQPVERILADAETERRFSAEEAREYGLVDHVVRHRPRG